MRAQLARHRAVVLTAAPGAGKTTRVPPALIDAGPVILLQPRRVAARAVARRIAEERHWTLGREIGWQIRFERRFTHETRLLVVTEGILTARLQQDPLLSNFATVVLDEFHERSIHADMGLALARQAWLARRDLRIVVMSATLNAEPIARFLGECGVVNVPGALHPLTVEYAAGESMLDAVTSVLPRTQGQLLCFLPGAREIDRARADLTPHAASRTSMWSCSTDRSTATRRTPRSAPPIDAGSFWPPTSPRRRSRCLESPVVIDSGQVKVARYDAERGVDSLTLERVTQDSADQRAGRAARLGPGTGEAAVGGA